MTHSQTVYLLRHGQTSCTVEARICGRHDPRLTLDGVSMARAVRRAYDPAPWQTVYSSPLQRALETASIVASADNRLVVIEDDFRELDYGSWDNCLKRAVEAQADYRAWRDAPDQLAPPLGESGETVAMRASRALRRCLRAAAGSDILVVTHKAVIRLLVCDALGVPLAQFRSAIACPLTSMTTLRFVAGKPMLTRLADVSHLPDEWRLHPERIDGAISRSYGEVHT